MQKIEFDLNPPRGVQLQRSTREDKYRYLQKIAGLLWTYDKLIILTGAILVAWSSILLLSVISKSETLFSDMKLVITLPCTLVTTRLT